MTQFKTLRDKVVAGLTFLKTTGIDRRESQHVISFWERFKKTGDLYFVEHGELENDEITPEMISEIFK